ncbi:MAG: 50S ribosomal protein L23 [Candidatus Lokiarchaeota archaeon]|nr:50S ribosomal protein L23 [Candidatus Lokiarchaeota archaeon]
MDPYKIIISPVISESAFELIEFENKLTFIVSRKANKHQIRDAVKELYDVEVEKVNTMIQLTGEKKAIVRLSPESDAAEVATKLGIY